MEGNHNYFADGVLVHNCHILAAKFFSRSMSHIPARYKLAMSATPTRRDGCENLFLYQFGSVCVEHEGDALEATVKVFDYHWGPNEISGKPAFVKRRILMRSARRNKWIAKAINSLYANGRHILVMSEEIAHLQALIGLCSELGIPDTDLGLYCRTYIDADGKPKAIKDSDLDWVEKHSRVIFSVYVMAKDGLDIPRLDAGIDAYPRAEGIQVIGRIRRPVDGKPEPLWVTIRDKGIPSMERSCQSRIKDYKKTNCKILECGSCIG